MESLGRKLSPDWKFIFPNPKIHILEISSSAASLNLKSFFNLKPKTNLCIESSQRQNSGYRSRATRVHPKSQSGLNQRNYLSLRESLHWLESTSVWVGLHCVTRAPLLYLIRSCAALSFKICDWVSQWGISNTCPDLYFLQYIKAWMSSTDPVSSITNCYRPKVSYTDPVHSFIIS